jgi:hypothetical protein
VPEPLFLALFVIGAAVDGFWLATRYPSLGPKTIRAAGVAILSGCGVVVLLPAVIPAVVSLPLPQSALLAAFGIGFSAFVYLFLTAAWFVRVMNESLRGFMG